VIFISFSVIVRKALESQKREEFSINKQQQLIDIINLQFVQRVVERNWKKIKEASADFERHEKSLQSRCHVWRTNAF